MQFKLSKYLIPSITAMVVVGTNANIDGFFIGRMLGDAGLAAINIVWPIVAFIASLGTGIGVGGSVIMNRQRGSGKAFEAERFKNTTLCMLTCVGVLVGTILFFVSKQILVAMGAEGEVLKYAEAYAKIISAGAVFQIIGAGVLVLLRNDHKTYHSMMLSLTGLTVHIVLNFALVKMHGMYGVAAANVISQAVIMVIGLATVRIDRKAMPKGRFVLQIFADTAAPFGINFVPSLVLLLTNSFSLYYGGTAAVSAYAAMSYAVYTFDYVFQGICDGIQPIVSYCIGERNVREEARAIKCASIILLGFSLLCVMSTPLLVRYMPGILGVSDNAVHMMKRGFWFYAISYPFKAAVKFVCSYYYATGKRGISNVLVYLDPFVFTPGFLLILTCMWNIDGVWLSLPAAQIMLALIGTFAVIKGKNRREYAAGSVQ